MALFSNKEDLMKYVNSMTNFIKASYDMLGGLSTIKSDHDTFVKQLDELIHLHNQYVGYIKENNFCKAPILQVQKALNAEYATYKANVQQGISTPEQLNIQLAKVCELGKKYAHKTKFTVMDIPAENLEFAQEA